MPTLEAFFSAAKSIVTLGAKANAENRAEIRTVVGNLADQLDRALALADVYLGGALVIKDPKELETYLVASYTKIMQDFHDYKVCSALYQLADEFKQLFSSKRLSVSVGELAETKALIERLRDGERAVIDSLEAIMQRLSNLGVELGSAGPRKVPTVRRQISIAVGEGRAQIANHRKHVKTLARRITDNM
jgi:hypothetical protein